MKKESIAEIKAVSNSGFKYEHKLKQWTLEDFGNYVILKGYKVYEDDNVQKTNKLAKV